MDKQTNYEDSLAQDNFMNGQPEYASVDFFNKEYNGLPDYISKSDGNVFRHNENERETIAEYLRDSNDNNNYTISVQNDGISDYLNRSTTNKYSFKDNNDDIPNDDLPYQNIRRRRRLRDGHCNLNNDNNEMIYELNVKDVKPRIIVPTIDTFTDLPEKKSSNMLLIFFIILVLFVFFAYYMNNRNKF